MFLPYVFALKYVMKIIISAVLKNLYIVASVTKLYQCVTVIKLHDLLKGSGIIKDIKDHTLKSFVSLRGLGSSR